LTYNLFTDVLIHLQTMAAVSAPASASGAKYWCWTWNNPTKTHEEVIDKLKNDERITFIIFQREKGDSGTEHYQGYLECEKQIKTSVMKKILDNAVHWEGRRGSQKQAIDYVTKEEGRMDGPWEWGTKSQERQGKRNDLKEFIDMAKERGMKRAREEDPSTFVKFHNGLQKLMVADVKQREGMRAPEVILLYGPPNCGKTRLFYDTEMPGDDYVRISCASGYWFDGYEGQEAALLDDFDGRASKWTLAQTLQTLDRYVFMVPIKGGFTKWNPERIYVTTNIHPFGWFEWENRMEQKGALKRRFTKVMTWSASGQTCTEIKRDDQNWDKWWDTYASVPIGQGYTCKFDYWL